MNIADVKPRHMIPTGQKRWSGSDWYYQVLEVYGVCGLLVRTYDDAYSESWLMPWPQAKALINEHGLWQRVGIYQFARADDPAAPSIRYANRYSAAAGKRLHDLEQGTKELHIQVERLRSALRDCCNQMTYAEWDMRWDKGFLEARNRAAALLEEGE